MKRRDFLLSSMAGAVGAAGERVRFAVVVDRILHFRSVRFGAFSREAHFHALHCLQRHDGLSQLTVQASVPGDV